MSVDAGSRAEAIDKLVEVLDGGLHLLEDAFDLTEPWGGDVIERDERRADTLVEEGAIPHGNAADDDLVVARRDNINPY